MSIFGGIKRGEKKGKRKSQMAVSSSAEVAVQSAAEISGLEEKEKGDHDVSFSMQFPFLYSLIESLTGKGPVSNSDILLDKTQTPMHLDSLLFQLNEKAAQLLPTESEAVEADAEQEETKTTALASSFLLAMAEDELEAFLFLLPPHPEEADRTVEKMVEDLQKEGICYGIDETAITDAIGDQQYCRLISVAKGLAPKHGIDGQVIDLIPREKKAPQTEEGEDSAETQMTFEHWLKQVAQGEVICTIVDPEQGVDGMTVKGEPVRAYQGKEPSIPAGKNTSVQKESHTLVAECDGQLMFQNGRFLVEQVIQIKGDVDKSTGDLDVVGSVIVDGMVSDGFTIQATGNVLVRGLVENAFIRAGGNIKITLGMKGNFKGTLEAKGDITSLYLENCTVNAGGNVNAQSIINSTVFSGSSVRVLSGKGIIIGGTISALKQIEAKFIGNPTNRLTVLSVGVVPGTTETIREMDEKKKATLLAMESLEKDVAFLEQSSVLDEYRQKMLADYKLKLSVQRMMLAKLEKQLKKIREQTVCPDSCIIATTMHPPVNVTIGKAQLSVQRIVNMCKLTLDGSEIAINSK